MNYNIILGTLTTLSIAFSAFIGGLPTAPTGQAGGIANQSISQTTPFATSLPAARLPNERGQAAHNITAQAGSQTEEHATTPLKAKIATTTPDVSVKGVVREYFADVPELVQVARCESHFRQFDKNGRVLRGAVNKGDLGVMQINEYYHGEKADELGYDLYTIDGNLAYARFLYDREGLTPWLSSSKCWNLPATTRAAPARALRAGGQVGGNELALR